MYDKLTKNGLSLSIVVGILLVPLSAVAAIWLTNPGQPAETSPLTSAVVTNPSTTHPTNATTVDITDDLNAACGVDGMQLISLEESQAITDVQQAALDALREVCEQQGIPLPPKPVPDPILQTVVVPAAAAVNSASTSAPSTFWSEDHDDDEYEHQGEYEHEEDHEYEYEDEDDD